MAELFAQGWTNKNGPPQQDNGRGGREPTRWFLRWCEKLADLTDKEFARAFKAIELLVERGDIEYPPNFAQFRGYALGTRTTKEAYEHRCSGAYREFVALEQLPTPEERAERLAAGHSALAQMRAALGVAR